MINRITEAFTKPYFEMTAVDGLIVFGIIYAIFIIGYLIYGKFFEK